MTTNLLGFCTQGMAGNIIHAIATTNATIAGMIVVEAMKILAGLPKSCKVNLFFTHIVSDLAKCMSFRNLKVNRLT